MVVTLALASVGWVCMVLFHEDAVETASREAGTTVRPLPVRDDSAEASREPATRAKPIPTTLFSDPDLASDPGRPAILVVDQIGRPVENAHVWIRPGAAGAKYRSDGAAPSREGLIHGKTDGLGRFLLEVVPKQPFRVDAISGNLRGKAVVRWERPAGSPVLPPWVLARVKLFPERVQLAYVTARLMKADGSPARRTKFVVLPYRKSGSGSPGSEPGRLFSTWRLEPLIKTTDENGRFGAEVPPETEGFLEIRLPPPGVASRRWLWNHPRSGEPLASVSFPALRLKECKDLGDVTLAVFDEQLTHGGLAGRVRCENPSLGLRPAVSIRLDDQARHRNGSLPVKVGADGSFETSDLLPGVYRLMVSINGLVEAELGGLRVEGGQVARPADIQDLIVGSGIYRASIMVRDLEGHPVSGVEFLLTQEFGRQVRSFEAFTNSQGSANVVLRRNARVSVHASRRSYCSQHIADAHFPLDLVLKPGIELLVTLSHALPRVEDAGSYFLHVIKTDTEERIGEGSALSKGGRMATISGLTHGRFRVAVVFRKSIEVGEWSSDITVPLGAVTVRKKPSHQAITIPIDLAEVTQKMRLAR
jgi:hypothetical protein